jgi:hypothetical protein
VKTGFLTDHGKLCCVVDGGGKGTDGLGIYHAVGELQENSISAAFPVSNLISRPLSDLFWRRSYRPFPALPFEGRKATNLERCGKCDSRIGCMHLQDIRRKHWSSFLVGLIPRSAAGGAVTVASPTTKTCCVTQPIAILVYKHCRMRVVAIQNVSAS